MLGGEVGGGEDSVKLVWALITFRTSLSGRALTMLLLLA
jgi:hypothetical protein